MSTFYFDHLQATGKISVVSAARTRTKSGKLQRKKKPLPIELALSMYNGGPNMSRKKREAKLYPFPSFDRSDALLHFPSAMSACLNSGDFTSLTKLFASRVRKDCQFLLSGKYMMTYEECVRVMTLNNDVHPDSILAVHRTEVSGNKIRSFLYYKYTESKALRRALSYTMQDLSLLKACPSPPDVDIDALQFYVDLKERELELAAWPEYSEQDDLVVYGTSTMMTITVDEFSKKITQLEMVCGDMSFGSKLYVGEK